MSFSPLRRANLRLLICASIFVVLIAIISFKATRQRAAGASGIDSSHPAQPFEVTSDGGLTPAAATITVNSTSDASNSSDGLCTLREAIAAAIVNSPSGSTPGECTAGSSGPDVISLTSLTGVITLATNMSALSGEITINGPGAGSLTVTRSSAVGTPNFRIFNIGNSGVVTISGLTISNGSVIGSFPNNSGGAIWNNSGNLTIKDCVLTGNSANASSPSGFGGAIYNDGSILGPATLTIVNSTISSNSCTASGGAIYNNGGNGSATLTISNSTIDGNSAANGGGIYSTGQQGNAPVQINNSTISGNTARSGGGIQTAATQGTGPVTIVNSTISGNRVTDSGGAAVIQDSAVTITNGTITNNRADHSSSSTAGGFRVLFGTLTLRNTIVARNFESTGGIIPSQISGSGASPASSFNVIGNGSAVGLTDGVNNNQVGVADPKLATLANNGGSTKTHALLAGSPALDAGSNAFIASPLFTGPPFTDQRITGFSRIVDGLDVDTTATVDVGAYETQPALADLTDIVSNEDVTSLVSFDVGDPTTVTSITATASNATLVPNDSAHLSVALLGSTAMATINPAANLFGTTNISITINRNGGGSENKTFMLTVNSSNDAPTLLKGADPTINEDAGPQTIAGWATNISPGPADESGQTTNFQVTGNSNASLFSLPPAISPAGTLSFTAAPNANGAATITVQLTDNGGTANGGVDTTTDTFIITVNAVNDVPSFVKGTDRTVNEDSGFSVLSNWANSITAGPANESSQTLSFIITSNTNTALFSTAPFIDSQGTLSFIPANNANGSATITIVLKDDGGTTNGGVDTSASQTFTISVNAVNDPPSFTKGANQTANNDTGAQTINNWATNIFPGPSDESAQTVTFQLTSNSNIGLFSVQPAISPTGTLTYTPATNAGGAATVMINLQDNGGTASSGVDTSAVQSFTITVNPIGGFFSFASATSNTTENSGSTTITVVRTGDTARAATVDYATNEDNGVPCMGPTGVASPKCDFTAAIGTLSFAAGDTSKTITILISQDSFVEGVERITVSLANTAGGAALGALESTSVRIADDTTEPPTNVIDDANMFVRMHYHDFLNREGDQSGIDFWTNQITSCGSDSGCIEARRIDVSASFFLSIEFQQTGYLVERFYKVAFGDAIGDSTFPSSHQLAVPVVRFNEFLHGTQRIGRGVIVLQPGWEQLLESNKQAYALEFVQTSRFITAFPTTMTPAEFVDKLNLNSGNVLTASERTAAINLFGGAANTSNNTARAQAGRLVAEDADLYSNEYNRAFVLAQYFGYLRRNPNDPQDSDYTGYDFWLTKLNQFNGNYINAEMVKAFLSSIEYRQRFGP